MPQNTKTRDKLTVNPLRRSMLKTAAAGLLACAVLPFLGARNANAAPKDSNDNGKTGAAQNKKHLIVYYSRSGNTRTIAQQIQQQIGGDILELETVSPYPDEYRATTEQAKKELANGYKPPLKTAIPDLKGYDFVFVGSPNWWNTIAGPVRTFLTDADLSGKRIATFITHEGSGLGSSIEDIQKICPQSEVVKGLAIRGGRVREARAHVSDWLRVLGLAK